jgi:hypothetical protein
MLSPADVRGYIESLLEDLRAEKSESQAAQVEILCNTITGQISRLLAPVPVPYKTGTRSHTASMLPATELGVDPATAARVKGLISQVQTESRAGRGTEAIALGETALAAWRAQER